MLRSSHRRQVTKNQRLQGITVPPCVGLGDGTGVVTGNRKPTGVVVDVVVNLEVIDFPSGNVVASGVVMPVGNVKTPSVLDITVSEAEFNNVTSFPEFNVVTNPIVVVSPSGRVVVNGVVMLVARVMTPPVFEMTVSDTELTDVTPPEIFTPLVLAKVVPFETCC